MSLNFIIKRVVIFLIIIAIASSVNFFIPKIVSDVDPVSIRMMEIANQGGVYDESMQAVAAEYFKQFGLDQPLWKQYLRHLVDTFTFDLGVSFTYYPSSVTGMIMDALPWIFGLLIVSTLLSFLIGGVLGALLGWPYAPRSMRFTVPPLFIFSAIPYYMLGLLLIYVFAYIFKLFPTGGGYTIGEVFNFGFSRMLNIMYHAILPAISIVIAELGIRSLVTRGMILSLYGEDYIKLAEAKGLPANRIFIWYGLRNTLLPQFTILALHLGHVASGALLVEIIFGYPGLGALLRDSVTAFDYPVIYGIVFVLILGIALATLVLDFIYPKIDPRITYED